MTLSGPPSTASDSARRLDLLAVPALVVAVLAVVVAVRWRCMADPAIPFLTAEPPAEWIVPSAPYQVMPREVEERLVRFRTTFDLPSKPRSGQVRLRAFREHTLRINGRRIGSGPRRNVSWKHPQRYEATAALKRGKNVVEVEVIQVTAPPALWLVMQVNGTTIKTDGRWQARTAGGPWESVHRAVQPVHNPITEVLPTVVEAWRDVWGIVLVWLAVALVATVAGWCVSRRGGGASVTPVDGVVRDEPGRHGERLLFAVVIVLWVALCANNLYRLPPVVGFDAVDHLDYVRFVQTRHRLPLATDGWEMYQPPLYYAVTALLVIAGISAGWAEALVVLPKFLSMVGGLAQVVLIWLVARIVFTDSRRGRCAALILAAAMPMNLYIAQYPSNEMACAALVAAALVLALRIIRDETTSLKRYAVLGVVLGLAMLAKYTALMAIVAVAGIMAGRLVLRPRDRWRSGLTGLGAMMLMVLLVAGWFGVRNWIHFRNPLIGNWDPASGHAWWLDPGYMTSAYYLRFGRSLTEPIFAGLYSYADGLYSTVWGDGLLGGNPSPLFRSPWHYGLMVVGYTLAVFPGALIAVGLVAALVRWARRPTAAWALLVGHGFLVGLAVFYMTVKLPYYAQVKGFYGLTAMACVCALGAWGFDLLSRWLRRAGVILWIPLLVWAINAYASFFVWPHDVETHRNLGEVFRIQGMPNRSVKHYRQALQMDPDRVDVYAGLGSALTKLRRYAEARRVLEDGMARDPSDVDVMKHLAWLLATCPRDELRNGRTALRLAQRACNATRYKNPALLHVLAAAQAETGQFTNAVRTLERAIRSVRSLDHPGVRLNVLPRWGKQLDLYKARRPYRERLR